MTPLVADCPTTDAEREAHEGELLDVTGQTFTVTDNFDTNRFAEIGLATGDKPLIHPLDVGTPGSPEAAGRRRRQRGARRDPRRRLQLELHERRRPRTCRVPWLTPTNPIRVGSPRPRCTRR